MRFNAWAGGDSGGLVYDLIDDADRELMQEALESALPSAQTRGAPFAQAGPVEMYPGQHAMVRAVLIPDVNDDAYADAGRILLTFVPTARNNDAEAPPAVAHAF